MASRPSFFFLANSQSCRVLDRFSDLPDDIDADEDEHGRITFWPLLQHLLYRPISSTGQLIEVLQTIGANAESTPDNDFAFLKQFLLSGKGVQIEEFLNSIWPNLRDIASDLPDYFPDGQLNLLEAGHTSKLSRGQVACLVIHQFLCSAVPQRHDDGYQDFGLWYNSGQRHPAAVEMYLTALFAYFSTLPDAGALLQEHQSGRSNDDTFVTYTLHKQAENPCLEGIPLGPVQVDYLADHTTDSHQAEVQGPHGAAVVSANKVIGFGQSATQEEIYAGIAPEACPVVLVAPHLSADTVIIVSGARAMLRVVGQRRDITWQARPGLAPKNDLNAWSQSWRGGRLIFMDALEMDMVESPEDMVPDLLTGNIDRELRKAFAGFVAASERDATIWTGLWGCGAFCGDAGVKLLILWLAASAAGVQLRVMLSPDQHEIGRLFETRIVRTGKGLSAQDLRKLLSEVPAGIRKLDILEWVARKGFVAI
ncbi:hypothetical protein BGZ63DRAFT_410587 [Mariannaea sp. PMI_226]|nr:hypothetical protein BGZ63DRAFT_410587 [Mariannaea sp. PMI_226]